MTHQLKASFLPVLLLALNLNVFGQTPISIENTLFWADLHPEKKALIPEEKLFLQAFNDPQQSDLPFFIHQDQLKKASSVTAYRFTAEEVTSLPQNYLRPDQIAKLNSDWQITAKVTDGAGIPYLVVSVLPIRLRNGQLERLTSYRLEVDCDGPAQAQGRKTLTYADNSVLAEGTWYKIAIARDGIYRIDRAFLSSLGINLTNLNPQQINIYGNGGELVTEDNSEARRDDLVKNAIFIQGESDGTFDNSDFILFYGKGPDKWQKTFDPTEDRSRWIQTKHYYSDSAYYFIRVDDTDPSRVTSAPLSTENPTYTSSKFQDYQYSENDQYNLVESGREFYGDLFDATTNATYTFNFPNVTNDSAMLDFTSVARTVGSSSSWDLNVFNLSSSITVNAVSDSPTSLVARKGNLTGVFTPTNANINVGVAFNKGNADAQGWLDYIAINATRNLVMVGSQMKFRDTLSVAPGAISRFELSGANNVTQIWDITDITQPKSIAFTDESGTKTWSMNTDVLHEFIALSNAGFLTPTARGSVLNQNLHSATDIDLVIVTAPNLVPVAEEFAAIHSEEGLNVIVATAPQVFNEFSSGNPDPTAIRTFMKMFYDRANGVAENMPQNLMLLGDGNYLSNKTLQSQLNNYVIVFESNESLSPVASYVSDDYFVFLSDDDVSASPTQLLDCGVGRIPATTLADATNYLNKVRAYIASNTSADGGAYCLGDETQSSYGPWRNMITFVSDDQDGSNLPIEPIHLWNSNTLADNLSAEHPEYDVAKIFMDAYVQETTPGGERYADGEIAIQQRVQNGTLLVTYIGHGGEKGWAHERILDIPTIQSWTNLNRLPVFLTATCELARYDDPSFYSAGEILVMNPNGGAIAMLTTTRIVFSGDNYEMDLAFFDVTFEEETITDLTLGKINMLTKNNVSAGNDSKPNFSLLGDPALKMAYPKYNVYTTHINGIEITAFNDTIKSLQEVEITGYVGDLAGNKLNSFNGTVYPNVFDKASLILTQNNDGGIVQQFETYNKIIYRGKASATAGDFSFKFVVPYDINFSVDSGRVSYYAVDGDIDAHGSDQRFKIGSALTNAQLNTVGPEISIFMNDTTFISGGVTNTEPLLLVILEDENGINTVGNGIGHDLTAILDNDTQNPVILNDFYEADLDTYQSGQVRYQLSDLPTGEHSLKIKAWDVHNNSNDETITFVVADDAGIALEHVLNYPNPFTTRTEFFFEHNQACTMMDVRIQIFTVGGKLVKTINESVMQNGFRSSPIAWDGLDDFGDRLAKGVYVYKIEVRNDSGQKAEQFEKLVILK